MHKPKITNSITELHIGYVPDKSVTSVTDGPKMQTFLHCRIDNITSIYISLYSRVSRFSQLQIRQIGAVALGIYKPN